MQLSSGQFANFDRDIESLREIIRSGRFPQHPELVHLWFEEEGKRIPACHARRWEAFVAQFHLLLDAYADVLTPAEWRQNCLNHIYLPLVELERLASTPSARRAYHALLEELRVISHYFET